MTESIKYVEVLVEVGASIASVSEEWPHRMEGVPPVVEVREDWQGSYDEICKYKQMLDGLDYNAMFVESKQQNAKEILTEWRRKMENCITSTWKRCAASSRPKNSKRTSATMKVAAL